MLSSSNLVCMSKTVTEQEAQETGLDGHAIMGKLIPVLTKELLVQVSPLALSLLLWDLTSGCHRTTTKGKR